MSWKDSHCLRVSCTWALASSSVSGDNGHLSDVEVNETIQVLGSSTWAQRMFHEGETKREGPERVRVRGRIPSSAGS